MSAHHVHVIHNYGLHFGLHELSVLCSVKCCMKDHDTVTFITIQYVCCEDNKVLTLFTLKTRIPLFCILQINPTTYTCCCNVIRFIMTDADPLPVTYGEISPRLTCPLSIVFDLLNFPLIFHHRYYIRRVDLIDNYQ